MGRMFVSLMLEISEGNAFQDGKHFLFQGEENAPLKQCVPVQYRCRMCEVSVSDSLWWQSLARQVNHVPRTVEGAFHISFPFCCIIMTMPQASGRFSWMHSLFFPDWDVPGCVWMRTSCRHQSGWASEPLALGIFWAPCTLSGYREPVQNRRRWDAVQPPWLLVIYGLLTGVKSYCKPTIS